MSSEERLRKRQFNQAYGIRDVEPLKVNIISEVTPANKDDLIYLLIHGKEGSVSPVGFADMNRSFTFAFSNLKHTESFLLAARQQELLKQVGRILTMTVGEFFDRKKQGWTKTDICIDPIPGMLNHPNVKLGIKISN